MEKLITIDDVTVDPNGRSDGLRHECWYCDSSVVLRYRYGTIGKYACLYHAQEARESLVRFFNEEEE